jgi:hypothetical protein
MVWAPDSLIFGHLIRRPHIDHLTLGRAVDLFLAAKAAEGAAAKTLEWYGMILRRAVRGLGEERPIEQLAGPELRAWILELRATLSTISVAGYVRTLKVFGNWLAAEELAQAAALRTLRKRRGSPTSSSIRRSRDHGWHVTIGTAAVSRGLLHELGEPRLDPGGHRRHRERRPTTSRRRRGSRRAGIRRARVVDGWAGCRVVPEVSQCSRWPSVTAMTWIRSMRWRSSSSSAGPGCTG